MRTHLRRLAGVGAPVSCRIFVFILSIQSFDKYCKAFISVLGDEESAKDTLAGLVSATGYIRRELARSINLRNTPELTFVMDNSIEYGIEMSRKIDEVLGEKE